MIVNDITSIILLAPLLLPLMEAIGVSPVQFAAIMGVNTAMGGVTPPYAIHPLPEYAYRQTEFPK